MILESIQEVLLIIGVFVSLLFILSVFIKRNDIADIAWGVGIFLVALVSFWPLDATSATNTVLLALVGLWAIRLSVRILLRNIKKEEDSRYKKWRDEWGKWFYPRSYLQVYLLQGSLMVLVGYPFVHASTFGNEASLGAMQYVGLVVWIFGFIFEVVADWQLDRFLAKPADKRDKILQTGLWRYSRHPNYFGEVTMWWGIWLIVSTLPFSYVALIGPVTITFLILKVSGVPMLEKSMSQIPEYKEYKRRTSVFFPLPPKDK